MKLVLFYTTVSSLKEARKISTQLIDSNLAVCTNILGPIESHYKWKGQKEKAKEYLVLIKALSKNKKAVEKKIQLIHSYDIPIIAELNLKKINTSYLKWALAND